MEVVLFILCFVALVIQFAMFAGGCLGLVAAEIESKKDFKKYLIPWPVYLWKLYKNLPN